MPIPAYQYVEGSNANTAAFTLAWTAAATGEVGILLVASDGDAPTATVSGWTAVVGGDTTTRVGTSGSRLQLFWRRGITGGSNDADIPDLGSHALATIIAYDGCVASGVPVGAVAISGALTSATRTFPTVDLVGAQSKVLLLGASAYSASTSTYPLTNTNGVFASQTEILEQTWNISNRSATWAADTALNETSDTTGLTLGGTTAALSTASYDNIGVTLELLGVDVINPAIDTSYTKNIFEQDTTLSSAASTVDTATPVSRAYSVTTGVAADTAPAVLISKEIFITAPPADTSTANGFTRTPGPNAVGDVNIALSITPATSIPLIDAVLFGGLVAVPTWGVAPSDDLTVGYDVARTYTGAIVLEAGFVGTEAGATALGVALTETANLSPAVVEARGIAVAEALGVDVSTLPNTVVGLSYADNLALVPGLLRFLGGTLADTLNISSVTTAKKLGTPVGVEALELSGTSGMDVVFSITSTEELTLTDAELVQSILLGNITEGLLFTLGALSDAGDFTTWAMNTATLGVAGYDNYEFNSYAGFSGRYLGASSSGLYTLDGDDDAGTDVIATLRSGFTQFAGAKLSVLDAAYLGVRGDGDFIFKVVTAEGKTYSYAARVDSMKTARVTLGRGLRTRYIAFELVSTGQDFDLESVEFSPLDLVRRV